MLSDIELSDNELSDNELSDNELSDIGLMKGKLVSFEHTINFNRVQGISIHRSSLAVIQTDKVRLVKSGGCVSGCHKAGGKLCNVW